MATDKRFLGFVLEQLSEVNDLTCKPMMGEYILYCRGKIVAYVCDDRLLVKPVRAATERLPAAELVPPYEGAKPMLLVDDLDDRDFLKELFEAMADQLPEPRKGGSKRKGGDK